MGLGSANVRVTADVLITQAEEVRKLAVEMETKYRELESKVNGMGNYWMGDASDSIRGLYSRQKENVEVMIKRIKEHPDDLLKISGNYQAGEKNNVSTAQALNADVIL